MKLPAIELNLLQLLFALARSGTVPQAMAQLGISQSTLRRGLAELRDFYQNELFLVENGCYLPNAFAKQLLTRLEPALIELQTVMLQREGFQFAELEGTLTLSVPPVIADWLAPEFKLALDELGSKLQLEIMEWPSNGIKALQGDRLHLAVNTYPQPDDSQVIQKKLGVLPTGVYCRKDHLFAARQAIELSELASESTMRLQRLEHGQPEAIRLYLQKHQIQEAYVMAVNSPFATLRCVESLGYVFVSGPNYLPYFADTLCWRPILFDGEPLTYDVGMAYHRAWYRHPAITQLSTILLANFE